MRTRDTAKWGVSLNYPDQNFFLNSPITNGLHTIQYGGQLVDILVRDRGSDTTVVVFHASVKTTSTYPILSGESFTANLGVNLISLSDPGVAVDNEIRLGWFIGTRVIGDFRTRVTPLINHILDGLGSSRTILWGSSGGGYAAVNFAQDFPESLVLAINPRLNLTARPTAKAVKFVNTAFKPSGRTAFNRVWNTKITKNLGDLYPDGFPAYMGLYQNLGDTDYLNGQFRPFVREYADDPLLWIRTEEDGVGHVPIPRRRMLDIMAAMSDTTVEPAVAMDNAGFTHPVVAQKV